MAVEGSNLMDDQEIYNDYNSGSYPTAVGEVSWQTDRDAIVFLYKEERYKVRWNEISAAAIVSLPQASLSSNQLVKIIPGLNDMSSLYDQIELEYAQLVLGRGTSSTQAVRLPIPKGDPQTSALIQELQGQLLGKWHGEIAWDGYEETLGFGTPRWVYAMGILVLVLTVFLLLQVIGAVGSLATDVYYQVPALVWLAGGLWFLVVSYLVYYIWFKR